MKYEEGKSPLIKGFIPGLPERGKIKIGRKGKWIKSKQGTEFQLPEKLDHFIVTTMERDEDSNFVKDEVVHKIIGDKPKSFPVILIYDAIELNFQSRFACYKGRTLFCSGDGEFAFEFRGVGKDKKKVKCPCERADMDFKGSDKCKPTGRLSVIIAGIPVLGGVWVFRTTSYNSIKSIVSSLAFIKSAVGRLAGVNLDLVISPKTVTVPGTEQTQTIHVVSLEYKGDLKQLQEETYQRLLSDTTFLQRMKHIEDEARQSFSIEDIEGDPDDEVPEFYPEAEVGASDIPDLDPDKEITSTSISITEQTETKSKKTKPKKQDAQEKSDKPDKQPDKSVGTGEESPEAEGTDKQYKPSINITHDEIYDMSKKELLQFIALHHLPLSKKMDSGTESNELRKLISQVIILRISPPKDESVAGEDDEIPDLDDGAEDQDKSETEDGEDAENADAETEDAETEEDPNPISNPDEETSESDSSNDTVAKKSIGDLF